MPWSEVGEMAVSRKLEVSRRHPISAKIQYTDADTMPDLNRYRLRRVDENGNVGYSASIELNFFADESLRLGWISVGESLQLYWVDGQLTGIVGGDVINVAGSQVDRFSFEAATYSDDQIDLLMRNVPTGIYFVQVRAAQGHWVKRFRINNNR